MSDGREYYERIRRVLAQGDETACPACDGAQYVRFERPLGSALFGKTRQCPACAPVSSPPAQDAPPVERAAR